jgi:WxL domain surface cell wall-binding
MPVRTFKLSIAALLALGALAPASALAVNSTLTGTVNAGSLSLSTAAAPSFTVTLDGTDQLPTYTLPMSVNDLRGAGSGWNTTITSTTITTGTQSLSTSASSVTGVTSACAATTCTAATNSIAYPLAVPAATTAPAAVKLFNAAANTGLGKFTVTPTVSVSVPGNAYAGSYTSTITLAAVSGP